MFCRVRAISNATEIEAAAAGANQATRKKEERDDDDFNKEEESRWYLGVFRIQKRSSDETPNKIRSENQQGFQQSKGQQLKVFNTVLEIKGSTTAIFNINLLYLDPAIAPTHTHSMPINQRI